MVILAIRARDDSAPVTPLRRICRPGAESRFSSEVGQEAVVAAAAGLVLGERGDGDEHERGEEEDDPFQNACPMPM